MNGIPAIGINLNRVGEDVENDIAIDIQGIQFRESFRGWIRRIIWKLEE